MIPKNENIIECVNKKEIVYFTKGHYNNEVFWNKLKNSKHCINEKVEELYHAYGRLMIKPKGLTLKMIDFDLKTYCPITYIKIKRNI